MKKKIIVLIFFLLIFIGTYIGYKNINKKENIDPIDKAMLSYKNYEFHDIKQNDFKMNKYEVNYDMTKESSVVKVGNLSISAYLVDDILHIRTSSNIVYKYPDLGEIDRLMFYKYCNCENDCYRLVLLTEEGTIYYLNLDEDIDFEKTDIFKKIESNYIFTNIGYANNINIDNSCGVNSLVTKTDNLEIYFDDSLNEFKQDYYSFIKLNDTTLYIYPDGSIKLFNQEEIDVPIKISEVYISDIYLLVGKDKYLYELKLNGEYKKIMNKKISKIGYNNDKIIVIFEDATAKRFDIKNMLK